MQHLQPNKNSIGESCLGIGELNFGENVANCMSQTLGVPDHWHSEYIDFNLVIL